MLGSLRSSNTKLLLFQFSQVIYRTSKKEILGVTGKPRKKAIDQLLEFEFLALSEVLTVIALLASFRHVT
jgi:hypothetical protein